MVTCRIGDALSVRERHRRERRSQRTFCKTGLSDEGNIDSLERVPWGLNRPALDPVRCLALRLARRDAWGSKGARALAFDLHAHEAPVACPCLRRRTWDKTAHPLTRQGVFSN